MNTLAANPEAALLEVRRLSAGELVRTETPRRVTACQLTRQGRPILKLAEVRNGLALPLGRRIEWRLSLPG